MNWITGGAKIITKEKSGKKDFGLMTGRKKGCIFSARGIAKNVREWSNGEKRIAKRVYCKIKMPIIFIKGSCVETPLYTMCWGNKDGDKRQAMRKGGRYEARRVKRAVSIITCNLTASATHHLVSVVPRIWIDVSKSPFLIRVESLCALSYYFTRLMYKFM